MTTIKSKRHPFKFYFYVTFVTLILFGIGTLILSGSIEALQKGPPTSKWYFMLVLSLALYMLALGMCYAYWKNAPKIMLDKQSIKFGDKLYYLKDIEDIILTGKKPFKFIISFPMEGTALSFNDGTEKILFDDMYTNSSDMKLFLEQVVLEKQDYKPRLSNKINKHTFQFEKEEIFKGNQWTSLRGFLLWGMIGFLIVMVFSRWQNLSLELLLFSGGFGMVWFVLQSWLMHYFGLATEYLIVRNHNFIWKVTPYRLTNIKEIVFETKSKRPNSMRIITKDFKDKLYPAGTLRNKTWLDLKDRLEARGVTVRNECIPQNG